MNSCKRKDNTSRRIETLNADWLFVVTWSHSHQKTKVSSILLCTTEEIQILYLYWSPQSSPWRNCVRLWRGQCNPKNIAHNGEINGICWATINEMLCNCTTWRLIKIKCLKLIVTIIEFTYRKRCSSLLSVLQYL